ncbi:MAG: BMP family ABC transporter substrate-binding protein [Coriobacteriia bacterium]|nr:BMP family ABC transporter substrate-binding protein [Coriobacteriia bacterium]
MKKSFRTVLALLMVMALSITVLAGCSPAPTTPSTPAEPAAPKLKAGMVTDIGGLGDKSFNDLSYAGLQKAESELGVEIKAISSKAMTDYDSNIAQLANAKYDVIFCVGFLMTDAISKAATTFPDTKFGGIDIFIEKPAANEAGLLFKEQEAGYLAGVSAGLLTKDTAVDKRINGDNVIGFVGGMPIPPVKKFEAGFIAGAKSVNPSVKVISLYAGKFDDQAKGKELGLSLISQKADIIFAAAGQTGIGTFQACKEKNAFFIGVDSDQYNTLASPGDTVITSAMKRVDTAVFETVKKVKDGTFASGNTLFGLKENGVDLAPWHEFEPKVPQSLKDAIEKAKKAIIDGSVTVPEDPAKA